MLPPLCLHELDLDRREDYIYYTKTAGSKTASAAPTPPNKPTSAHRRFGSIKIVLIIIIIITTYKYSIGVGFLVFFHSNYICLIRIPQLQPATCKQGTSLAITFCPRFSISTRLLFLYPCFFSV